MYYRLIIVISFFLSVTNAMSQTSAIELIGDVKIDSFPSITLHVNHRDSQIFDKEFFKVKEKDSLIDFVLKHPEHKVFSQNKNVLILIENLRQKDRNLFNKKVLQNAIEYLVNEGDHFQIATFDRIKNDEEQSLLDFKGDNYTDDSNTLLDIVKKIPNYPTKTAYNISSKSGVDLEASDLYFALYKGVTKLSNDFEKDNFILVFSAGFNNRFSSHSSTQSIMELAREKRIPIYSIQYRKQGFEHHKLTDLCNETYGAEFISNKPKEAASQVVEMMRNALEKAYGNDYEITYTSSHKADGLLHHTDITIDKDTKSISYTTPKLNFFKKMWKKYKYLSILAAVLLIALFGFLLLLIIKNREKQAQENALLKEEVDHAHMEAQQNKTAVINQERALNEIKQKEQNKIDREKREKIEQDLLLKMRSKGRMPELHFTYENRTGMYSMKKPLIKIGRAKSNDLILDYPSVSREHAQLYFSGTDYYILDTNSATGVLKNGVKVTSEIIKHSDTITIGGVIIYFKL